MARRPSLNPFRLTLESWRFLRRQPALWHVLAWFMIVPAAAMDLLETYRPVDRAPSIERIGDLGYGLATIVFLVVAFWATACIQIVGRRMIQSKAGRSRTSFKSVRRDAVPLILPLFFTDLLRTVITLEWALLYVVPSALFLVGWNECRAVLPLGIAAIADAFHGGSALWARFADVPVHCFVFLYLLPLLVPAFIYQVRTFFYDAVVGAENLRYRQALRRSSEVTRGRFWRTLGSLLGLALVTFAPAGLVAFLVAYAGSLVRPSLAIVGTLAGDLVFPFAWLLFALGSINLYGKLRKMSVSPREVKPKDVD